MTDQPNPRCGDLMTNASTFACGLAPNHDGPHEWSNEHGGYRWPNRIQPVTPSGARDALDEIQKLICLDCGHGHPASGERGCSVMRADHQRCGCKYYRPQRVADREAAIRAESAAEVERLTAELREARDETAGWERTADAVREHADAWKSRAEAAEQRLRLAPLCDEHGTGGGVRVGCLVCSLQELSAALSRIDYLCGDPNDMEVSGYDVHCDETAVVIHVEQRLREVEAKRDRTQALLRRIQLLTRRADGFGEQDHRDLLYRQIDSEISAASRPVPASRTYGPFGGDSLTNTPPGINATPAATPEKEQPR